MKVGYRKKPHANMALDPTARESREGPDYLFPRYSPRVFSLGELEEREVRLLKASTHIDVSVPVRKNLEPYGSCLYFVFGIP